MASLGLVSMKECAHLRQGWTLPMLGARAPIGGKGAHRICHDRGLFSHADAVPIVNGAEPVIAHPKILAPPVVMADDSVPGAANTTLTYLETDRDRICRIRYGADSGTADLAAASSSRNHDSR